MNFLTVEQLTTRQVSLLKSLVLICKKHDKYTIPFYPTLLNKPRPVPSTILCMHKNKLIAFTSAFFFYQDSCEIAVIVDPKYRRRGIAKKLLTKILSIIEKFAIHYLIFSAPHELHTFWFLQQGFTYERSEYQLKKKLQTQTPATPGLSTVLPETNIRLATPEDIPILCSINEACFATVSPNLQERFKYLFANVEYTILVLEKNGKIIGKLHSQQINNNANFTDIAILPEFQKMGYGKYLLNFCINFCANKKLSYITLDVEITNKSALKLYTNLGFTVINAYDFWKISIAKCINILK